MISWAIEEDSDDGSVVEIVKHHNNIIYTELPSLVSTYIDQATQIEHALAIVTLVGGTESVTVDIPGGAASTNFLNLNFVVPRKFSLPCDVLKEVCPGMSANDPRVSCTQ